MGKTTPKPEIYDRVSWAPMFWAFALMPWRIALYLFYVSVFAANFVLVAVIVAFFVGLPTASLALFAGLAMPVATSQESFFAAFETLALTFIDFYNEFLVAPWNQIAECLRGAVVLYNTFIAFVEAIIATIAAEFGLDIFEWTLRRDVDQHRIMRAQQAIYAYLKKESEVEGRSMVYARLYLKAGRVAQRLLEIQNQREKRLTLQQIIQVICTVFDAVFGFLIALIKIFGDFILLILGVLLDVLVEVGGNFQDVTFIFVLVKTIIEVVLDLVDPLGCFHPFDELPDILFPCICPHAYDSVDDVPGNIINAMAGCICPGINLFGDLIEDILKPCAEVDYLEFIINIVLGLITLIFQAIDAIQAIVDSVLDILGDVLGLKDEIESVKDAVTDIICGDLNLCRRSVLPEGRFDLVEILDPDTNAVVMTFYMRKRSDPEEDKRGVDTCVQYANLTHALMDEGLRRLDFFNHQVRIHRANADSMRSLHEMGGRLLAAQKQQRRDRHIRMTLENMRVFRNYLSESRNSVNGMLVQHVYEHLRSKTSPAARAALDREFGVPDDSNKAQMADYRTAVKGVLGLGSVLREAVLSLRRDPSTGKWNRPTVRDFMNRFQDRGIDVLETVLATIRAHQATQTRTDSPPTFAENVLNRAVESVAQASLVSRATMDPEGLPSHVKYLVGLQPELAPGLERELDELDGKLTALMQVRDLLKAYHNATLIRGRAAIPPETLTQIRALLKDDVHTARLQTWRRALEQMVSVNPNRARHPLEPDPEEKKDGPVATRVVIIVSLVLIGAGFAACTIQLAACLLTACLPVVLLLLLALAPVFLIAIFTAADAVLAGTLAFFNGGKPQGVDFVTPFIVELGPQFAASYTEGWHDFDIEDFLDTLFDLLLLDVQYIVNNGLIRRFACLFPTFGILNACPGKPTYDKVTGRPLQTTPEYLLALLSCEQDKDCTLPSLMDEAARDCICDDGRKATEESPCPSGDGKQLCWPYGNENSRLQEVTATVDLQPGCKELGWVYDDIMPYQTDDRVLMICNWFDSSVRSTRFVLNRFAIGVFFPWIGIFAPAAGLIFFPESITKRVFWGTFVFNGLSAVTVPFSQFMIDYLEGSHVPFRDTLLAAMRFPNYKTDPPQGSPTTAEWMCLIFNTPQVAASSVVLVLGSIPVITFFFALGPLLVFWIIVDILLWPANVFVLFCREMYVSSVLWQRRMLFKQSLQAWRGGQGKLILQPGINTPMREAVDAVKFAQNLRTQRDHYNRHPNVGAAAPQLRALDEAERYLRISQQGGMPALQRRFGVWPDVIAVIQGSFQEPPVSLRRLMT